MKLKLQFWKTDKAVAVSVLECEGIPATNKSCGDAILVSSDYNTRLFDDSKMCINNRKTGKIDVIEVDNPREYIDKLVNNIARELFVSKQQKVEVGDIIKFDNDNSIYTVINILPEEYYNRYIVTNNHDRLIKPKFSKRIVYAFPNVSPVNKEFTVMKDVTGNVETYTWES